MPAPQPPKPGQSDEDAQFEAYMRAFPGRAQDPRSVAPAPTEPARFPDVHYGPREAVGPSDDEQFGAYMRRYFPGHVG